MITFNEVKKDLMRRVYNCRTMDEVRDVEEAMKPFFSDSEITGATYFTRKHLEIRANKKAGKQKFNFSRKQETGDCNYGEAR